MLLLSCPIEEIAISLLNIMLREGGGLGFHHFEVFYYLREKNGVSSDSNAVRDKKGGKTRS